MSKVKFLQQVYIVLGIDQHEFDQVLSVFSTFEGAKKYCMENLCWETPYFDLWIEKHEVN